MTVASRQSVNEHRRGSIRPEGPSETDRNVSLSDHYIHQMDDIPTDVIIAHIFRCFSQRFRLKTVQFVNKKWRSLCWSSFETIFLCPGRFPRSDTFMDYICGLFKSCGDIYGPKGLRLRDDSPSSPPP